MNKNTIRIIRIIIGWIICFSGIALFIFGLIFSKNSTIPLLQFMSIIIGSLVGIGMLGKIGLTLITIDNSEV